MWVPTCTSSPSSFWLSCVSCIFCSAILKFQLFPLVVFPFNHISHNSSVISCFGHFLVEVLSFQCFAFISPGVNDFYFCFVSDWLCLISSCFSLFLIQAPSLFVLAFSSLLVYSDTLSFKYWENVFLFVEYLYWFFSFFCAVGLILWWVLDTF